MNRVSPTGVNRITFYQSAFDANTDYIERDDDGNIIGFWADYYTKDGSVAAKDTNKTPTLRGEITFSGATPQIKLGGGYKKLAVNFYDGDKSVDMLYGAWKFYIDNEDVENMLQIITSADSDAVQSNEIKIKIPNANFENDALLGKKIKAVYEATSGVSPELYLDIIGL